MLYLIEMANFQGFGDHCFPQQILVAKVDERKFTANPNFMCYSLKCGEYKKVRVRNYKPFFVDFKAKVPIGSKLVFEDSIQADIFFNLADEETKNSVLKRENCCSLNSFVALSFSPAMNTLDRMQIMINAIKENRIGCKQEDPKKAKKESQKNDSEETGVLKCESYCFVGDKETNGFHALDCPKIKEIPADRLQGLGKNPFKSGFHPEHGCECWLDYIGDFADMRKAAKESAKHKVKETTAGQLSLRLCVNNPDAEEGISPVTAAQTEETQERPKEEILRAQIRRTCNHYDMYVEFCDSVAYITTVAGEWYMDYTERPVSLWHKNSEIRLDRNGNIPNYYHNQKKTFHAPLHAIAYINQHEQAEERRLMGTEVETAV